MPDLCRHPHGHIHMGIKYTAFQDFLQRNRKYKPRRTLIYLTTLKLITSVHQKISQMSKNASYWLEKIFAVPVTDSD